MDVAVWLRELGLERYEAVFRDNEIDWEVLSDLTEADLKDLGIPLGPRKKLLKAIAALEAAPAQDGLQAAEPDSMPAPSRDAERRQLTVMFVDLVGSTELSRCLDPEDMSEVMRAYHGCASQVIQRWGGHIAKYLGDGVLAYFGWPQAHEDDAERAVRAGLGLAQAIAGVDDGRGGKLAVRVGIATGPVVVGELIGEGAAQEQAVVGETPNLAARLQTSAPPGGVVISATSRRLLGALFETELLEALDLKGFGAGAMAFRVLGEGRSESRFEALHGERLTPLVGREHELGLLLDRWSQAKDGEGQIVLLSGEPGIGKSRLIQALRERLREQPHMPLPHYGSAHHTRSVFHPIVRHLERAAGFAHGDPAEVRLDKLEALLRPSSDDLGMAVPLIAPLLGLDPAERYPALDLTPERRKQLTLEALVGQVEGLARAQPVLAIYEDAQWFDPSSLDGISLLIERAAALRVMVLIAFRPDFTPPWRNQGNMTSLSLSRLARRDGARIIARLTGGRSLPAELEEQLLARTDGIPLFVEELTKVVLESGLIDEAGGGFVLKGPLPPLAIPSSLHDSLMARLDRLAPVKEVAQIAAVIGREFPYGLLAAVAGRQDQELEAALARLEEAELIYRRGLPPEATYAFKHALVQDAAYQSLLKARRQQLHAKIADVLEQRHPETAPELLALHCTEAGLDAKAIMYWFEAGRRATQRSANVEAVGHIRKSIDILAKLPHSSARDRQELELQLALGSPLIVTAGYAAAEVEQAYLRARELSRKVGDVPRLFTATWGLWITNLTRMQLKSARGLADELLSVAEQQSDTAQLLQARHATWTTCLHLPELVACSDQAEQGMTLYDRDRHRSHKFLYGGHDPGVCAGNHLALTWWLRGFPDQALVQGKQAVALSRELGHPFSLVLALTFLSFLSHFRRESGLARKHSDLAAKVCTEEHIAPHYLAIAEVIRGWAEVNETRAPRGVTQIRHALDRLEVMRVRHRRSYYLAILAEACDFIGKPEEGLSALNKSEAFVEETGEGLWQAEVQRLKGQALLHSSAHAQGEAEASFRTAMATAHRQKAMSLELRTATSLARLWAERSERQKAHDLLAPIYGWFTEGLETPDLIGAKRLLDELA